MTLITLSTAWLIGIAAAHYLSPPLTVVGLLAILFAALLLWRDDPGVRRIAACGLFFLLGSARYALSLPDLSHRRHIAAHTDQGEVVPRGKVAGEPDVRDTYTNLRLVVDRLQIEDEEHAMKARFWSGRRAILTICTAMSWNLRGSRRRRLPWRRSPAATIWPGRGYMD